ncbi:hypothetical protein [Streptomyces bluensis]|uniref:Integral membrane protein n=1 Tax=Streptomyces bluensis TaxID=33897 RepID=A0ABW6URV2_9ACTN
MPDRSLRLPPLLLRERRSSPTPPGESKDAPERGQDATGGRGAQAPADDNPFAPPPEGTPDRPWRPRRPAHGKGGDDEGNSPWGSQWSDRQPGRSTGGGFGERPRPSGGGQGGPEGGGPGGSLRWDPTDPAQRRARYALLAGMWAFFFSLFSWPYMALLLGALSLYWGVSALRAKPRRPDPGAPASDPAPARPQTTAAISGLVTATLALIMVAATFSAQLVYRDYYTCTNDALTTVSKKSCEKLLPEELRGVLGTP